MPNASIEQYSFHVEWSKEDDCFIATSPEFPGFSAHGPSRTKALEEAEKALELRVEAMIDEGMELPEPNQIEQYSGQTRLRMPKWLHRELAEEAERQDVSLNSLLVSYLGRQLGRDEEGREIKKYITHLWQSLQEALPRISQTRDDSEVRSLSGSEPEPQDPVLRRIQSGNTN